MDAKSLEELKKQYGEVIVVGSQSLGIEVVLRPARRTDVARFVDQVVENKYKAMHALVMDCAVYPDRDELAALFEKHPMAPVELANQLVSGAGLGEVLVKKV